jgi:hypothetical protein
MGKRDNIPRYNRQYYESHKDEIRKQQADYHRKWYAQNKETHREYNKKWSHENKGLVKEYNRKGLLNLKVEVFLVYSHTDPPQCANPYGQHKEPYTDLRALTLDLISGGHSEKGLPTGKALYFKLKREGYPEGWQVLCMNCQWVKKFENHEWGHHD